MIDIPSDNTRIKEQEMTCTSCDRDISVDTRLETAEQVCYVPSTPLGAGWAMAIYETDDGLRCERCLEAQDTQTDDLAAQYRSEHNKHW